MLRQITVDRINDPVDIFASDDSRIYASILGTEGIHNIGNCMNCEPVGSNQFRISDGVASVQGHIAIIDPGDSELLTADAGVSGYNRIDLIVLDFETDGQDDKMSLKIIKGKQSSTATDPSFVKQDLTQGGTHRQVPLWRVKFEGTLIKTVERYSSVISNIYLLSKIIAEIIAGTKLVAKAKHAVNADNATKSESTSSAPGGLDIGNEDNPLKVLQLWSDKDLKIQLRPNADGSFQIESKKANGTLVEKLMSISAAGVANIILPWDCITEKPSTFAPKLGETSTTAYRGDKGKALADSLVSATSTLKKHDELIKNTPDKNLLINGDFQVWQRGTEFTSINAPRAIADMWYAQASNDTGAKINKVSNGLKITKSKTITVALKAVLPIEDANKIRGKTASLYYKANGEVYSFTLSDYGILWIENNKVMTSYTKTVSQMSNTEKTNPMILCLQWTGTENIIVEWVQLSFGTEIPNFVREDYETVYAKCERFYAQYHNLALAGVANATGASMGGVVYLPTVKYRVPTISSNLNWIRGQGQVIDISGVTVTPSELKGNAVNINFSLPAGRIEPMQIYIAYFTDLILDSTPMPL